LKSAVEGKLTEQWRAKHPAKEPASALLARILLERRLKWEADQLAKFAAAKKEPPKNWRDKYVEPTPPIATGLPELPADWTWASVQQVGSVQLGRQRAPQHHSGEHMRPYLRVANVFEDRIDTTDVMEMNFTPDEYETYRLGSGDILLNEGQSMELVGRPAIYRDEVPGACFTNTLVRFRVYDNVDTDYALRVFLAYLKNGRFQKIATITVNIAHLGAGRFAEIEFPLPPIEEQAAIIQEVDRHFSQIDAAEKQIEHGLLRAARLRQSILKRAFEGKLVPQDPKDEPASALLERLRASRTHDEANGTTATSKRTRAKIKESSGEPRTRIRRRASTRNQQEE
jgi:type I restriction enzyme S subunit